MSTTLPHFCSLIEELPIFKCYLLLYSSIHLVYYGENLCIFLMKDLLHILIKKVLPLQFVFYCKLG